MALRARKTTKQGYMVRGNGGIIFSRKDQVDVSWLEVTPNVSGYIG